MDQISQIRTMIQPVLEQNACSLYDLRWVQDGKMRVLQVSIMHADGSMDIDTCAIVSEGISALLDESGRIRVCQTEGSQSRNGQCQGNHDRL